VISRATDGIANFGAELYHRLVHLRLDLLLKRDFPAFENFVDVRAQLARLGIDYRELLFNSEGERVLLRAHGGAEMFLKNVKMSCGALQKNFPRAFVARESLNELCRLLDCSEHRAVA